MVTVSKELMCPEPREESGMSTKSWLEGESASETIAALQRVQGEIYGFGLYPLTLLTNQVMVVLLLVLVVVVIVLSCDTCN